MKFFDRLNRKKDIQIDEFFRHDNWLQYVINRITGNTPRYISSDASDLFKAFYSTAYSCIDKRGKAVAGTGWKLFTTKTKTSSRSKAVTSKRKDYLFSLASLSAITKSATDIQEVTSSPILDLLWQVSDIQNEYNLKQGTTTYQDIEGDCFWYLPKGDVSEMPIEINFIQPQFMTPIRKTINDKPTGQISHYVYKLGQEEIRYETGEIVQFKYFNPYGGVKGFSPTRAACESISLDKDMVDYLFDSLANRLRQEMLLTSEGQLSPSTIESIQKQMKEYRKAKKDTMPLLPGNLKAVPLSGTIKDLPFNENRRYEREQICAVFGVPVTMFTRQSSRAEREAAKAEFAEYTVSPLCEQFQQQLNQKFIPMFGDDSLFIAFDDPIPSNRELDLAERTGYVNAGIWSINEVRAEQNMEAVDNGDTHYIPSNLMPIGTEPAQQGKAFADAVIKELEGEK